MSRKPTIAPGTKFMWDGCIGEVKYQIEIALPFNGKRPRTKLIDNYSVEIVGSCISYLNAKQIRAGVQNLINLTAKPHPSSRKL